MVCFMTINTTDYLHKILTFNTFKYYIFGVASVSGVKMSPPPGGPTVCPFVSSHSPDASVGPSGAPE